jgi:hypothetical protein
MTAALCFTQILNADGVWRHPHEDVAHSQADAEEQIAEWFALHDDEGLVADLTTVMVWLNNDAGWRDATEDALINIGAAMSALHDADDFPDAFLRWADSDIQDDRAEQAERDRGTDERRYSRGEAAA